MHPAKVRLIEQQVLALPRQQNAALTLETAWALAALPAYERSLGMGEGAHYRRPWGTGCLHLRITDTRAFIHWDGWDPRRYPVRHVVETPVLLALAVLGVMAVSRA